MKNLLILIASSITLLVCNCPNDKQNGFSYINHFKKNERVFDTIVKYIEKKYITTDEGADLTRKLFSYVMEKKFLIFLIIVFVIAH